MENSLDHGDVYYIRNLDHCLYVYKIGKILGKGSGGSVFEATRSDGLKVSRASSISLVHLADEYSCCRDHHSKNVSLVQSERLTKWLVVALPALVMTKQAKSRTKTRTPKSANRPQTEIKRFFILFLSDSVYDVSDLEHVGYGAELECIVRSFSVNHRHFVLPLSVVCRWPWDCAKTRYHYNNFSRHQQVCVTNLLVPWEVVVIMSSQQDLSLKRDIMFWTKVSKPELV